MIIFFRIWTRDELIKVASTSERAANARWDALPLIMLLWHWALENRKSTMYSMVDSSWLVIKSMLNKFKLKVKIGYITSSALTQARQNLGLEPFYQLHEIASRKHFEKHSEIITYKDRDLYVIDGSNLNLPSCKSLSEAFGRPNSSATKKSLPQASFTVLELLNTDWIVDYKLDTFKTGELSQAKELVSSNLSKGDILLADRLYFDTKWYASMIANGLDFMFRVNSNRYKSCTPESREAILRHREKSGNIDLVIELRVTAGDKNLPKTISVRYMEIQREGAQTLFFMTTLSESELNQQEALELYRMRWEIETDFRFFKGQDHLPVILSKTEETVRQEVIMKVIAHNSLRFIQSDACLEVRVGNLPKNNPRTVKKSKTTKSKLKSSTHSFGLRPVDLQYLKTLSIVSGYILESILHSGDRCEKYKHSLLEKIARCEILVSPNRIFPRRKKNFGTKENRKKGNAKAQNQRRNARRKLLKDSLKSQATEAKGVN